MKYIKKVVLLITVLSVSVISTACINNIAVQELNNKAKDYMANGEIEKAICRLRSSIDLDDSIFETHYNLGVALIQDKEYKEAQASLERALKITDFADAYYSLALAYEGEADSIISGDEDSDETCTSKETDKKVLTDADKTDIVEKYNLAIENYNKYLAKKPTAEDKDKVTQQIKYLNEEIEKYNTEHNTSVTEEFSSPSSEE